MDEFKLVSEYQPGGDQPQAIVELVEGVRRQDSHQTLLGVTGSGKTFTMANVIQELQMPALVISHNKTLAAQLYGEFKGFFPDSAVEYFVSYYDYYQPEAYKPSTDTYIEKEAEINEEIDRLRLKAFSSLLQRRDVIIISTVSCIYGVGSPREYDEHKIAIRRGEQIERDELLRALIDNYYRRNDIELQRGCFRVRGDIVEIIPGSEDRGVRIEMFGDEIESIHIIDSLTGEVIEPREQISIFPAKAYVTDEDKVLGACDEILTELESHLLDMRTENRLVEAHRLETRTKYDVELIREVGFCPGIENYSRYMDGREPGTAPYVLIDYFPEDYLLFVDESHVTIPQVRGMYRGDRSRKENLIEHGFRLPSAYDNRPLVFKEFEERMGWAIFVSATPSEYELKQSDGVIVEQVIRPTGLVDPSIEVRPLEGHIDDLIDEIRLRAERKERVLVTTLTKRMAENLTDYFDQVGIRVRYLHSDIETLDRVEIIRDLRLGEFDVLVGINLLREGLDLPEVSLVAVLDADKEGFLRSEVSLIQTVGRAARNAAGVVIFYADKITNSMQKAMDETSRRRVKQQAFNDEHGIVPKTIYRSREEIMQASSVLENVRGVTPDLVAEPNVSYEGRENDEELLAELEKQMKSAAVNLEFEKAAHLRDEITQLKERQVG
ncbi:MAG TPA: excinuclease ABC subunit UvrB [Candidatus Latescibacteria bacterium]|nr:excinuclease ABC subunit UvrB [Candidatus Handelsmanbacteria bacterium]HIL10954.1 excinuclease ABC subunit UvrB [Candidatus Latescibacterota bacterium]